ncbi:MAG: hypothetical protein RI957_2140 [Verrucomicrobiota bacterium]|jgi:hypothetical protein
MELNRSSASLAMPHSFQRVTHLLDRILRPDPQWLRALPNHKALGLLGVVIMGFAMYGFTVGAWRAPAMGGYVALKMPLLILLTLGCNALLNGLLGILLHGGMGFRDSMMALLWAFATAAVLLASLSPVTLGLAWNAPRPDAVNAATAHAGYLLSHTLLIAAVGIFSNIHLHRLLHATGDKGSLPTLFAWLAGNGLLGSQFSWILRPFFGSPQLEVAFLRPNAWEGTFHEAVWNSFRRIAGDHWIEFIVLLWFTALPVYYFFSTKRITPTKSDNE